MRILRHLVITALFGISASAQNSGALVPVPRQQPLSNSGLILSGSCMYSYQAGSTTPAYTYSNADLAVGHRNANPLVLDSSGRMPAVYLDAISYKFVFAQRLLGACPGSPGTVIWSQDSVYDFGQLLKAALAATTGASLIGFEPTGGTVPMTVAGALNSFLLDAGYSTFAQACAAAGSTKTLAVSQLWAVPAGTYDCNLWFLTGGKLRVAASAAAVLGRTFVCPANQQCFDITTNSGATLTFSEAQPTYLPEWWGALGDGSTDDTTAITKATNSVCASGGALQVAASKVYIIAPTVAANPILPSCSNLTITGPGTIKIKNGAGSYYSIWGTSGATLSNFRLEGLTVDMNSAGNPVPNAGDLVGHPRIVLHTGCGGNNNTADHVHVTDIRSVWVFYMCGTNFRVTNNLLDNVGGGSIQADSSLIYGSSSSSGGVITGNTVRASARDAKMAISAIETHSQVVVADNNVVDMLNGMNITGLDTTTVSGISVTGNSVSGAFECISLWSGSDLGASTYGINGASVTGNTCIINQRSYIAEGGAVQGIILNSQASLPFAGIKINGNLVTFDLSNTAGDPYDTSVIGVGYWDAGGTGGCDDCDFSGNTVVNAPASAFRYSANGKNISFNNCTATNPGSHPNSGLNSTYRAGLFLSSASPIGGIVSVIGSTFSDTLTTSRMSYGVELATANTTGINLDGVAVSCSDAVCASLVKSIGPNTSLQLPYVRATANVPAAKVLPAFALRAGSSIYSVQESLLYTWDGFSYLGFIPHPGTPTAGADCGVGASVGGTDRGGRITLGAGATVACTVTFAKPFTAAYYGSVQLITALGGVTFTSRSPVGTVNGFIVGGTNLGSNIFEWAFPLAN